MQFAGDQLKITLQLIDGTADAHLWSHEYSGVWMSDEIFRIQSDVAENIAKRMNVQVITEEVQAIKRNPTQNKQAYDSWLKAKYQAYKFTREGMLNAIPLYEEAFRLDSAFLEPYIDLARLHMLGGGSWGLFSEREAWNKTKSLLLKARQIDSTHLEVTEVLNTGLYLYEWDFETMEKYYRKIEGVTVNYCLQTGRYEEALATIEKMIVESCEEQKMNVEYCALLNTSKAGVLSFFDRKAALEILKNNEKLYSDNPMFLRLAGRIYFYLEEFERSYALLNKHPDRPPILLWKLAFCEYRKGNIETAKEYISDMENRYQKGESGSPAWFTALYYASIGDIEQAFEWLQNSYDRHELEMIWLRASPILKPLRNDPRYLELYYKIGFPMPPESS